MNLSVQWRVTRFGSSQLILFKHFLPFAGYGCVAVRINQRGLDDYTYTTLTYGYFPSAAAVPDLFGLSLER